MRKWPIPDPLDEAALILSYRQGSWGRTKGGWVEQFEAEFSTYHQAKYAVAVTSATAGLTLSYLAVAKGKGGKFVVPSYTFIATATAGVVLGQVPIFIDIDPETLDMKPEALAEVLEGDKEGEIGFVVPVHFAGNPAEMDQIKSLAQRHGARVVEDAAQAHGSTYRGRKVGAIGDVGVFSFQTSKMMTAGEGGIVITDDREIYERVWSYHNAGRDFNKPWYEHVRIGWNYRMTEFQASVLIQQLRRLDLILEGLRRNAKVLYDELEDVKEVHLHRYPGHIGTNFYFLPMTISEELERRGGKAKLASLAAEKGVSLAEGYPKPLYRQEAFRDPLWKLPWDEYSKLNLKDAEVACRRTMWIPHYEFMGREEDALRVAKGIREAVREMRGEG
jgi:dTDP-4-amino-4,6-dideoxygalactose transaminase